MRVLIMPFQKLLPFGLSVSLFIGTLSFMSLNAVAEPPKTVTTAFSTFYAMTGLPAVQALMTRKTSFVPISLKTKIQSKKLLSKSKLKPYASIIKRKAVTQTVEQEQKRLGGRLLNRSGNPAHQANVHRKLGASKLLSSNGSQVQQGIDEDVHNPVFPKRYPTRASEAATSNTVKLVSASKTTALANSQVEPSLNKHSDYFQMLAIEPLTSLEKQLSQAFKSSPEKRQSVSKTFEPPPVSLQGGYSPDGILHSGIIQKVTSLQVAVGKATVVDLKQPAQRVSISNPEIASAVIISPTQIQLIGKSVGVCNLLVWSDSHASEHTVLDIAVHNDVSVLVNQLKYIDPGIELAPLAAEDTVILTGHAKNRESAQLAIEMAKAFFNSRGGSAGNLEPNSQAPGSATPGLTSNIINLIKVDGEPSTKIELVRQKLHAVDPHINVDIVPGPDSTEKIILTGRVQTASIASKALNLASVFYGQPGMKLITAQGGNEFSRMQVGSGSAGSSSQTSSGGSNGAGAGSINFLQGSVMTDSTGNVISMLEIAQKPQIRCSIKFLELNKSTLRALGSSLSGVQGTTKFANWSGVQSPAPGKGISALSSQSPAGSNFGTASSRTGSSWVPGSQTFGQTFNEVYQSGVTQVFTINNTIAAAIQALQEKSQVRTLAEPTLTLLSGEQGSFLAGGEVPIAFLGGNGQISVEYHEFGIRLNMLPNVTDDGKVQMQISPEVSSVDQSGGVSTPSVTVPAFLTRRMSTTLLVESGESFILSGLYSQDDTNSLSNFPVLGSLPIIGNFFRNKWKNRRSSEMVVLVKPEIIYSQTGQVGEVSSIDNGQVNILDDTSAHQKKQGQRSVARH